MLFCRLPLALAHKSLKAMKMVEKISRKEVEETVDEIQRLVTKILLERFIFINVIKLNAISNFMNDNQLIILLSWFLFEDVIRKRNNV